MISFLCLPPTWILIGWQEVRWRWWMRRRGHRCLPPKPAWGHPSLSGDSGVSPHVGVAVPVRWPLAPGLSSLPEFLLAQNPFPRVLTKMPQVWITNPLPLPVPGLGVEFTSPPNSSPHYQAGRLEIQAWSTDHCDWLRECHMTQLEPMRLNSETFAENCI